MAVTGWLLRLLLGRRRLLLLRGLLARLLVKLLLLVLLMLLVLFAVQLRVVGGLESRQGWSCGRGATSSSVLQLVEEAIVILLQLRIWWRRGERIRIHSIASCTVHIVF